jgi:hypothetical protein
MRKCEACLIEKPLVNFHKSKNSTKGYKYVCKLCRSVQEKKRNILINCIKYGISVEDYLLGTSENCPICNKRKAKTFDHDHKTGKFRGLLCIGCNAKIGWLENYLPSIIKYIGEIK